MGGWNVEEAGTFLRNSFRRPKAAIYCQYKKWGQELYQFARRKTYRLKPYSISAPTNARRTEKRFLTPSKLVWKTNNPLFASVPNSLKQVWIFHGLCDSHFRRVGQHRPRQDVVTGMGRKVRAGLCIESARNWFHSIPPIFRQAKPTPNVCFTIFAGRDILQPEKQWSATFE